MVADLPPWEAPFVADVPDVEPERHAVWDLYAPGAAAPRPVVCFVHGGPTAVDLPVSPRDWPVYRGYGALAARAGLVGITIDHPLYGMHDYPAAYAEVMRAIAAAQSDPRVDGGRVAVWAFSGGGPLVSPLLRKPPAWLRCIALSYPVLTSRPARELPAGFLPIEALTPSRLPVVLTRVGLESPPLASGVAAFLARAEELGEVIDVVDVPHGHHGFDLTDPGLESTGAVTRALSLVTAAISPDYAVVGGSANETGCCRVHS